MKTLKYEKDQVIFRQGEFARTMYDIVSGKVGVYVNYGAEGEKLIAELGSEDFLGEMGMIELTPRSATAVALEDTVLSEIGEEEFGEYFSGKPQKLLPLLRILSRRIRDTDEKYIAVCRAAYEKEHAEKGEKESRVNRQLEEICREYGEFNTLWLN